MRVIAVRAVIATKDATMPPALSFQFERAVREYAVWRAVPDHERSPAPAWWWATALALRNDPQVLPAEFALPLELAHTATCGDAAQLLLDAFEGQTARPWPNEFPRKYQPAAMPADQANP